MAPIMVIRNTFIDFESDSSPTGSRRRNSSAPGRTRTSPSFTVKVVSRAPTEQRWPISQRLTDELTTSLARVSSRLKPSHGHVPRAPGSVAKSFWPRPPPSYAVVIW